MEDDELDFDRVVESQYMSQQAGLKISIFKEEASASDSSLKRSIEQSNDDSEEDEDFNDNSVEFCEIKSEKDLIEVKDFEGEISADFYYQNQHLDEKNIKSIKKELRSSPMEGLKQEKVYRIRTIEEMIEYTNTNQRKEKEEEMTEEAAHIKQNYACWRKIFHDDNCFYRSVIFGWLEYIVLNSQTNILKIIAYEFDNKLSEKNPLAKRLQTLIKHGFTTLTTEKRMIINIILDLLVKELENPDRDREDRINRAYKTLITAFNNSIAFDQGMILYLRYLLYECMYLNKDKIISREYRTNAINLIHEKYRKNLDLFFEEDLLCMSCPGKSMIAYYIPFVLKVNLNILIYNYEPNCIIEKRFFPCKLQNKAILSVVKLKNHYDIIYTKEYQELYDALSLYASTEPELAIISPEKVDKIMETFNNDEKSKLYFTRNKPLDKSNDDNVEQSVMTKMRDLENQTKKRKECYFCKSLIPMKETQESLTLPCGCSFSTHLECRKKFADQLIEIMTKNEKLSDKEMECPFCSFSYSGVKFLNLYYLLQNYTEDFSLMDVFFKQMKKILETNCASCLASLANKKKKKEVNILDALPCRVISEKKISHFLCEDCCKNKKNNCKICGAFESMIMDSKNFS